VNRSNIFRTRATISTSFNTGYRVQGILIASFDAICKASCLNDERGSATESIEIEFDNYEED
jgi:hypothetical protein